MKLTVTTVKILFLEDIKALKQLQNELRITHSTALHWLTAAQPAASI